MKQIILLLILAVAIFAQTMPKLTLPVQITDYAFFCDGGSIHVELTDKTGKKIACFFDIVGTLKCNDVEIKYGSSEETAVLNWVKCALKNKEMPPRSQLYGEGSKKLLDEQCLKQIGLSISNYEKCPSKAMAKWGKTELKFRDPKGHFSFTYPVSWNTMVDGISYARPKSHIAEATLFVSAQKWRQTDPISWYKNSVNSTGKTDIIFCTAELPFMVCGVKAYRIWRIEQNGEKFADESEMKNNFGTIVFLNLDVRMN